MLANIIAYRRFQTSENNHDKEIPCLPLRLINVGPWRINIRSNVIPSCPRCHSKMVRRMSDGNYFYGCSAYPICKGTREPLEIYFQENHLILRSFSGRKISRATSPQDIIRLLSREHIFLINSGQPSHAIMGLSISCSLSYTPWVGASARTNSDQRGFQWRVKTWHKCWIRRRNYANAQRRMLEMKPQC